MIKMQTKKYEAIKSRDERILESIILAKAGDEKAFEELIHLMNPAILSISKSYMKLIKEDLWDIVQYSKIAILKAVNTFEPSKNKNARLFLDACIKKYLATKAKRYSRQKRNIINHSVSIDEPVFSDKTGKEFKIQDRIASKLPTVEQTVISKEKIKELKVFQRSLSARNSLIFELYFIREYSQLEVSQMMNLTRKQTDNAIYKLRKKIKQYILLNKNEILVT